MSPAGEYLWQAETRSPQPAEPPSADLGASCDKGDAALLRVAARVAERELGARPLDVTELAFALRVEGAPYVWPHLLTLVGPSAGASAGERVSAWLATIAEGGERRCGLVRHRATADGANDVVAAVAVSVLADLEPLPTRVRVGAWPRVRARMLVAASEPRVMVLGPRGAPRALPTTFDGTTVDARFPADRPGAWLVQVLAHVAGGPRPVAEAVLTAGAEPVSTFASEPAPGEDAATGADDTARLVAMVNGARRSEGLAPVERAPLLDRMALAHAQAMKEARRLAHDLGDGSPLERAARAGLSPSSLGENVAHSLDAERAHRVLWSSLSHRANLLTPSFDAIGVGAARDADGTLWVSEVLADLR